MTDHDACRRPCCRLCPYVQAQGTSSPVPWRETHIVRQLHVDGHVVNMTVELSRTTKLPEIRPRCRTRRDGDAYIPLVYLQNILRIWTGQVAKWNGVDGGWVNVTTIWYHILVHTQILYTSSIQKCVVYIYLRIFVCMYMRSVYIFVCMYMAY